MRLSAYSYTNRGGREQNEDSIRLRTDDRQGIFVLAVGLGGHRCGEVASAVAAEAICEGCFLAVLRRRNSWQSNFRPPTTQF